MSRENVEKLRRAYDAFSRGDFDEALTFAHPDIEFYPPGNAAPYRGIENFRAWWSPTPLTAKSSSPWSSSIRETRCSSNSTSRPEVRGVESSSRVARGAFGRSTKMALPREWRAFWSGMRPRPEKPPGFRSRAMSPPSPDHLQFLLRHLTWREGFVAPITQHP